MKCAQLMCLCQGVIAVYLSRVFQIYVILLVNIWYLGTASLLCISGKEALFKNIVWYAMQIEVQLNNIDEFAQQAVLFLRQPTFLQVVMLKNTSPHPVPSKQLPHAWYRLSVKDKKGSLDPEF